MKPLRLVTWNCRSGSVSARLDDLASLSPDIVFLQECAPDEEPPLSGPVITRRVNPRKGIALASVSDRCRIVAVESSENVDLAPQSIAAHVTQLDGDGEEAAAFFLLGVWAHPPDYADDVLRAVQAHASAFRAGPAVVMGDFNSGTRLFPGTPEPATRGHLELVRRLGALGLVSAYHAFHGMEHGQETHPTYYHRAKLAEPWHIDFCFVPEAWAGRVTSVHVGGPAELATSDHRAVMVEISGQARMS
jgi:endonuclease/exonuclease/phosphatase family metal-dependent hydrolase